MSAFFLLIKEVGSRVLTKPQNFLKKKQKETNKGGD